MTVSRTVNPLHFEDLEPHRFEDLVRQLAHGFRPWRSLEATGRLGRDQGVDIHGVEVGPAEAMQQDDSEPESRESPPTDERAWVIQCKRAKTFAAADARRVVAEAVPDGADQPYGLVVAVAADVTTETVLAFHEAARGRGITEGHLWTKAQLEDLLFRPDNDHLLFAYFGISLVTRRRGHLTDLRARIALKRKLLRALGKDKVTDPIYEDVLIRDISDDRYPYAPADKSDPPRWAGVRIEALHPLGLFVIRFVHEGWVKPDGTWDLYRPLREDASHLGTDLRRQLSPEVEQREWAARPDARKRYEEIVPESERARIFESRFLVFADLLEVDPLGDPWYPAPHLFVREGAGPYAGGPFFRKVDIRGADAELDADKRRTLFADAGVGEVS